MGAELKIPNFLPGSEANNLLRRLQRSLTNLHPSLLSQQQVGLMTHIISYCFESPGGSDTGTFTTLDSNGTMDFPGIGSIIQIPYQGKTVSAEVLRCQRIRRYEAGIDEVMLNLELVR
jgi:hypothetical protein